MSKVDDALDSALAKAIENRDEMAGLRAQLGGAEAARDRSQRLASELDDALGVADERIDRLRAALLKAADGLAQLAMDTDCPGGLRLYADMAAREAREAVETEGAPEPKP